MPDPANIDTLQAQRAQQQAEAGRLHALQHVLEAFAPGTRPSPVGYRVLLERVRMVLDDALARLTTPDPVPPTPPLDPSQGAPTDV